MIKEKIAKLIDVKSLITFIVIISYTVMIFIKIVEPDYKDLVIMILTYYFAKTNKSGGINE